MQSSRGRSSCSQRLRTVTDMSSGRRRTRRANSFWRNLLPLLGHRPWPIAGLIVSSIAAALSESVVLAAVAEVATAFAKGSTTVTIHLGSVDMSASVHTWLLLTLALTLARIALQLPLSYFPAQVTAQVQADIRDCLFAAFTRASWSVQSRDGDGEFQELVTGQALQMMQGAIQAATALSSLCMLAILLASALAIELIASLIVVATGFIVFEVMRPLNAEGRRQAGILSREQLAYASGVYEAVNLAEEAKVFGSTHVIEQHVQKLVERVRHRSFTTFFLVRLVPGLYQGAILLLLVGGLAAIGAIDHARIASLGAVVLLLVRASSYGQQVQAAYQIVCQTLPFVDRLSVAQRRYSSAGVKRGYRGLRDVPRIAFEQVSYAYEPRSAVLRSLTFQIEPGEAIGIVGPTGAGKSTLVQVLLGLREPESGCYLVDGEPSTTLSAEAWTRAFAYVGQEPRLLHGTVADNIRFFRDLNEAAVERAARLAHVHEDVMGWPLRYQTPIGQRADAVSGGQRQRICLARALAAGPFVLILDEPTSALDPRSESLVRSSLAQLKGQATLVVIAHRLSTLSICDRVMVIKDGRLDGFGRATELARSNAFYRAASSSS